MIVMNKEALNMLWLLVFLFAVIVAAGLTVYFWPSIGKWLEQRNLEQILKNFREAGCLIERNLVLAGTYLDYLIVAPAGVFIVKKCTFRKENTYLIGKETARVWYYYEPYKINPEISAEQIVQGAVVDNANRIPLPNPILECERVIKTLTSSITFSGRSLKFYPIVLLVPRIKGINLERIKNSTAKVIFPDLLEDIILDLDQQQIPVQELEKVKDKIINSAGVRRAG